jgi:hypothetical protein
MTTQTFLLAVAALGCQITTAAELYVATNGSDTNPGTEAKPFATLERARDAVRALKTRDGATVFVRGGTYFLTEPLVFTVADSGAKERPVTYAAAPGERPVISGGMPITGWRREGKLLVTTIPSVREGKLYFKNLFINGCRAIRAREPNTGFFRIRGPLDPNPKVTGQALRSVVINKQGFRFHGEDLKPWPDLTEAVVVRYSAWESSLNWIRSLNPEKREVFFTEPKGWAVGTQGHPDPKGDRYFIENLRAALDAPGEWHLDRQTGALCYCPRRGETTGTLRAVAGLLERVVEFRGDPSTGKTVQHIVLRGLTFAHTDWDAANTRKVGVCQAHITLGTAMLHATGAVNCRIEGCEFVHGGTHGIWLANGCKSNTIVRCQVHEMGGGGVYIGAVSDPHLGKVYQQWLAARRTTDPRADAEAAVDNMVDNCFIHDLNHVFHGSIGVWLGVASHTTVSRNEICDTDYTGVSVGWDWTSKSPPIGQANVIEGNHIHHIGYGELSDMAGIYTLGRQPGSVLRGNIIHDVNDCVYGGWGIYNDQGSAEFLIEKNIVFDTNDESYFQNNDSERNVLRNNILAFPGTGNLRRGREDNVIESPTLERNIIVGRNGAPFTLRWRTPATFRSDHNLFWDYDHRPADLIFDGVGFADWQRRGRDGNSVITDPLFVNAAKRDFRLKPNSPALALGFEPIDATRAGLYGDKAWVGLPKGKTFRSVFAESLPKEGRPVARIISAAFADDFESTPAGSRPRVGRPQDCGEVGTVRVTAGAGRDGTRGLVLSELPGAAPTFAPSLTYETEWRAGIATIEFDLMVEKNDGITFTQEWRDWFDHALISGPILRVNPKGRLMVNNKDLAGLPPGKWARVKITCHLGDRSDGTFDLRFAVEGEQPHAFPALPCARGKAFNRASWIGFLCHGQGTAKVHLDNLSFTLQPK